MQAIPQIGNYKLSSQVEGNLILSLSLTFMQQSLFYCIAYNLPHPGLPKSDIGLTEVTYRQLSTMYKTGMCDLSQFYAPTTQQTAVRILLAVRDSTIMYSVVSFLSSIGMRFSMLTCTCILLITTSLWILALVVHSYL